MPRKSAKSILEEAKTHVEEYGMNFYSFGFPDDKNLDILDHCPRSLIKFISGEMQHYKYTSIFTKPTNASANKALCALDSAAIKMGAEQCNNAPGDYAEGYSAMIDSSDKKAAIKLFDEALKLV